MISTLYEPFRHWSEKGSVYILSDLHFDEIYLDRAVEKKQKREAEWKNECTCNT